MSNQNQSNQLNCMPRLNTLMSKMLEKANKSNDNKSQPKAMIQTKLTNTTAMSKVTTTTTAFTTTTKTTKTAASTTKSTKRSTKKTLSKTTKKNQETKVIPNCSSPSSSSSARLAHARMFKLVSNENEPVRRLSFENDSTYGSQQDKTITINTSIKNNIENETPEAPRKHEAASEMSHPSIARRNLFGISLNHEQLKQDLTDMWREQIEQQKRRWNFDFETLQPLNQSDNDEIERFKWSRLSYYAPGLPTYQQSGLERCELANSSYADEDDNDDAYYEIEEEDEEDDEALAIPQFYKYQRNLKMNAPQSTLIKPKTISNLIAVKHKASQTTFEPIDKLKTQSNAAKCLTDVKKSIKKSTKSNASTSTTATTTKSAKKQSTKKTSASILRRPRPIKRNTNALIISPSKQELIITFSENRKDTLRSAHHAAAVASCKKKLTFNEQAVSAFKSRPENSSQSTLVSSSATATTAKATTSANEKLTLATQNSLKQQSLLDIFKQRKRRNTQLAQSTKKSESKESANEHALSRNSRSSVVTNHNLRSHSLRSVM